MLIWVSVAWFAWSSAEGALYEASVRGDCPHRAGLQSLVGVRCNWERKLGAETVRRFRSCPGYQVDASRVECFRSRLPHVCILHGIRSCGISAGRCFVLADSCKPYRLLTTLGLLLP